MHFSNSEAGGASCCCIGGEYGAEDGDPVGQRCKHEEVAEPGSDDGGECQRRDDRHQTAGESEDAS